MVEIKSIRDYIAAHPFFSDMATRHIDLVAGCGQLAHFHPGEFLIREGEDADSFYLIRHGSVAIESDTAYGGPSVLQKIGEGGVTGYSWLFPPYRNQFDSRALAEVQAIRLDGKCLRGKAEADHELGYHLMQRFAQIMLARLQATRRQMLDINTPGKVVSHAGTSAETI